MKDIVELIEPLLFEEGTGVFAVLDGASVPDLPKKLHEHKAQHECLYRGEQKPDMAEVAPYLVHLEANTPFTRLVLERGWGKHWGIFALANTDLASMRMHFRRFLVVHDAQGQPLYFRYYDPRVLRAYLPTCNAQELSTVFGPVTCYMLEGKKPDTLLQFRAVGGSLRQDKKELARE